MSETTTAANPICAFCCKPVSSGIILGDEHFHVHCACNAFPNSVGDELTRLRSLLDGLVKAVEPFAVFETVRAEVTPQDDGSDWISYRMRKERDCEFAIICVSDSRSLAEAYLKAKGEVK